MDGHFKLEVHSTYLHLTCPAAMPLSGETWAAVGRLCRDHDRAKALIEAAELVHPLDTMSAFESGRALAEQGFGLSIAICFADPWLNELTAFFKTVAQNRGVKIELFSDLDEACRWLDVETGEDAADNS